MFPNVSYTYLNPLQFFSLFFKENTNFQVLVQKNWLRNSETRTQVSALLNASQGFEATSLALEFCWLLLPIKYEIEKSYNQLK